MTEDKPKLLIVDDEPDQCEAIKSYFSKRDFLIFSANTGEEALSLIKEIKPDLVLLDMRLSSKMSGKDALRVLREYDKETKAAMVTGDLLSEEEIQEITDLGIVEFVHKPVSFRILEATIKKALKERYPKTVHFKSSKTEDKTSESTLRRIAHDLSNITSDISNKCELYLLDTEEDLNKDKTEKERLDEAIAILKSVLKSTNRLTDLIQKISSLAKR